MKTCNCNPEDTESFCKKCCPEEYEFEALPHYANLLEQHKQNARKEVIDDVYRAANFFMSIEKKTWRRMVELAQELSFKYNIKDEADESTQAESI